MDEIKAFINKLEGLSKEEIIKGIPDILEKVKAAGLVKVTKELPDLNKVIRNKMVEFEIDETLSLMKQLIPVIFDAMKELAESNEDLQEDLEDIEDTIISMVVEDADFAMTFIVQDGKFDYKMEPIYDADLVLKMSKNVMKDILSGESDPMDAFMSGDVKAEGSIAKAIALRSIFETLSEEFGFELM
ncbi:MAG: SCP2 sterol-binding domain-containing protein [Promethearchaeota archaeon]